MGGRARLAINNNYPSDWLPIREASSREDSESWYDSGQSIRMAIGMGYMCMQFNGMDANEDDDDVRRITFWGACSLDEYVLPSPPQKAKSSEPVSLKNVVHYSGRIPYVSRKVFMLRNRESSRRMSKANEFQSRAI